MIEPQKNDGVYGMVPRERMDPYAIKLRDAYARVPGAPLVHREFGFYCLERWQSEGMPQDVPFETLFHYDPPARVDLHGLGWCEAAFHPAFEVVVLEDRGDHELVQDHAGRKVLYFKGRRSGFMPTYVDEPVKDWKTWEENCKWRLHPSTASRFIALDDQMENARKKASEGWVVTQRLIGGYMYLRSLMGPEHLMYLFYDLPDLIHDCMESWFTLADAVIARHQEHLTLDEIYFAEDICYNHGILISPDAMKEFLFPYYRRLIQNVKARQLDKARHLYVQVDTDGYAIPTIPLYQESIGMDLMSPFEVAAGCDIVEAGRQFPELALFGGIDKRILAQGKDDIDRMVERILPVMRARGGYIPTCDHGVPMEVSYENYLHYRKRCIELGG